MNSNKKQKVLFQGTCIIRLTEIRSPYHGDLRGYRVQVAVPNLDGHVPFRDTMTVSFRRPYLIMQSSDFESESVGYEKVTEATNWLKTKGFSSVLSVEEYKERLGI